jgi:transposase
MVDDCCQSWQRASPCSGSKRRSSGHERTTGDLTQHCIGPWLSQGMPIQVVVTDGTTAESTQTGVLIEGLTAGHPLADQGYDADEIIHQAIWPGMQPAIPQKRNRWVERRYDKALYRLRHWVENAFLHLKRWRGMATCYAKNTASCLAAVHIRCISRWANIL